MLLVRHHITIASIMTLRAVNRGTRGTHSLTRGSVFLCTSAAVRQQPEPAWPRSIIVIRWRHPSLTVLLVPVQTAAAVPLIHPPVLLPVAAVMTPIPNRAPRATLANPPPPPPPPLPAASVAAVQLPVAAAAPDAGPAAAPAAGPAAAPVAAAVQLPVAEAPVVVAVGTLLPAAAVAVVVLPSTARTKGVPAPPPATACLPHCTPSLPSTAGTPDGHGWGRIVERSWLENHGWMSMVEGAWGHRITRGALAIINL